MVKVKTCEWTETENTVSNSNWMVGQHTVNITQQIYEKSLKRFFSFTYKSKHGV